MDNSVDNYKTRSWAFLILLLLTYLVLVIKNAWVTEDAYITLRVVDNFVNGLGLRWNVVERVQVYTHPLWMFMLAAVYYFTREAFFSTIGLSVVVSGVAFFILLSKRGVSVWNIAICAATLIFSKGYIDFSAAGLENPLSSLTLALFVSQTLSMFVPAGGLKEVRGSRSPLSFFYLTICLALTGVTRLDLVVLVTPLWLYALWQTWKTNSFWRLFFVTVAGMLPLILWELFSLLYYGFLFPNTAYAKLNTHIPVLSYIAQGLYYYIDSIGHDPITIIVMAWALVVLLTQRNNALRFGAIGILLYLIYIVRVGGDFMSGRFFTPPLFCAVFLLLPVKLPRHVQFLSLGLVVLVGALTPNNSWQKTSTDRDVPPMGVANEKAFWFNSAGLINASRGRPMPADGLYNEGCALRDAAQTNDAPTYILKHNIGYFGYASGPKVYIVDPFGLSDPFIARLTLEKPQWRIGHFERTIPLGYMETLKAGTNKFAIQQQYDYFEKLTLVTTGNIWDVNRLREIGRFLVGAHDGLLRWSFIPAKKMGYKNAETIIDESSKVGAVLCTCKHKEKQKMVAVSKEPAQLENGNYEALFHLKVGTDFHDSRIKLVAYIVNGQDKGHALAKRYLTRADFQAPGEWTMQSLSFAVPPGKNQGVVLVMETQEKESILFEGISIGRK